MKAQLLSRPSLVLLLAFLNVAGAAYAISEGVSTWLAAMGGILAVMVLGSVYRDLTRRVTTFRVYSHPLKGQPREFWRTIWFKLCLYGFISISFTFGPLYQVQHGIGSQATPNKALKPTRVLGCFALPGVMNTRGSSPRGLALTR